MRPAILLSIVLLQGCAPETYDFMEDGSPVVETDASPTFDAVVDSAPAELPMTCLDTPPPQNDPVALHAYLKQRAYGCWEHESARHASVGPHAHESRIFFNAQLTASMQGAGQEHAIGAIAINEMYNRNGELTGWAVAMKFRQNQPSQNQLNLSNPGWSWYETFDVEANDDYFSGQGEQQAIRACFDCHDGRGQQGPHTSNRDYIWTPFPLR